jgi:type VI secretion system protein ImpJ
MRNSKVIWREGMFLQPHHFQQQDRYLEHFVEQRCSALRPFPWGFAELKLDEQMLGLGKISIASARGVLPDGMPFNMPAEDDLPAPLTVPDTAKDALVSLALPIRRAGMEEVDPADAPESAARFTVKEYEARDNLAGIDNRTTVQVGKLRMRLGLDKQFTDAYTVLRLAQVREKRADGRVVLDEDFIPPCLDCRASTRLTAFTNEVLGLLHHRGQALASRVDPTHSGVGQIRDYLLLQVVNRFEPWFAHLAEVPGLHPESLYQIGLALAGELATFARDGNRPAKFPAYSHDKLKETFLPLIADLRKSLSVVFELNAISIPIEERRYGVRVAVVPNRELLKNASFVLAANAQMPTEVLRQRFPNQVTVGPGEKISELVATHMPGIYLRPLPVAPRQIPFHSGYSYFELDRSSDFWKQMENSAGFAFHIGGEFPGLALEFWAVRG